MKRPTFVEIMSWVLIVMVVIIVMFSLIGIMIDLRPTVQYNMAEKSVAEISENLLSSELTNSYSVFSSEKLSALHGKNIETARDCRYGYEVTFICLDKNKCKSLDVDGNDINGKYSFGYKEGWSSGIIESIDPVSRSEYIVAIEAHDEIIPAKMTIEIYDTPLTRTACMIETAYSLRKTQEARCVRFDKGGACIMPAEIGFVPGIDINSYAKDGDKLCVVKDVKKRNYEFDACRYMPGVDYLNFIIVEQVSNIKKIKAVPLKNVPDINSKVTSILCKNIPADVLAAETDSDIIIALCVE
ncbi:MAG: hypothetical protein V1802_02410 [Candidatus Aenigmatarchaeota archaeon]